MMQVPHFLANKRINFLLTLLILVGAFTIRVSIASTRLIGFDEAWDIFVARQDTLGSFMQAVASTSHPLGFYTLLHFFSIPSWAQLMDPLPSILCGVASIWIFGKLLALLGVSRACQWAGMLTLALSQSHTLISVIVRPYMLSVGLMLASLYFLLAALKSGFQKQGHNDWFFITLTAACLSHFSALLFAAALALTMFILIAFDPLLRSSLSQVCGSARKACYTLRAGIICGFIFGAYLLLSSQGGLFTTPSLLATNDPLQLTPYRYLRPFLRQDGQSFFDFAIQAITSEVELFIPLPWRHNWLAVTLGLAFLGLCAHSIFSCSIAGTKQAIRSEHKLALCAPVALFLVLLTLGVLGKYPVGGELRQQFFLFPLLLLAFFLVIDASAWRSGLAVLIAICAAGHFFMTPLDDEEFGKLPQLKRLNSALVSGDALFMGRWTAFTFYGQHRDWKLRLESERPGVQHYRLEKQGQYLNLFVGAHLYFSPFLGDGIPAQIRDLISSQGLTKLYVVGFPQGRMKCSICDRSALEAGLSQELGLPEYQLKVQRERTPNGEGFALITRTILSETARSLRE